MPPPTQFRFISSFSPSTATTSTTIPLLEGVEVVGRGVGSGGVGVGEDEIKLCRRKREIKLCNRGNTIFFGGGIHKHA